MDKIASTLEEENLIIDGIDMFLQLSQKHKKEIIHLLHGSATISSEKVQAFFDPATTVHNTLKKS